MTRRVVTAILESRGYTCREAGDGPAALAALAEGHFQLVVADLGITHRPRRPLVDELRERHPDVAVVVLADDRGGDLVDAALDCRAEGFLVKPFAPQALAIAVARALHRRSAELEGDADQRKLADLVARRSRELDESRSETVERLARAVESRDAATGDHIERMSDLAYRLALELGWNEEDAELLRLASVLHDVGKVAVSDRILLKPGPLDKEERTLIETHAAVGHGILAGARSALLQLADAVAWTHHERFDGTGYPRHLAGEQIPLAGRIAAVADVYDALTSNRPYRAALAPAHALDVIVGGRGTLFDPLVVDALGRVDPDAAAPPVAA